MYVSVQFLSEHAIESRSINPFNRFWTIYFVTSTGEHGAENDRNSPKHANSPEWLVLGMKYSPKSFYTCIWRVSER